MASTAVTQFPPATYSSSFFIRNIIKEGKAVPDSPQLGCFRATFLSKRSNEKKTHPHSHANASHHDDVQTSEKRVDFSELWKPRSGDKPDALAVAALTTTPTLSTFKRWRRGGTKTPSDRPTHPPENGCKEGAVDEDRSLLKFLALNALDLTAPASDILLKNRQNTWFQLSGHSDCFAPAGPGTIWKKRSGEENAERHVYEALGADPALRDCVPHYFREVEYCGEKFIELQDLLHGFSDPHVMDIKMGTRTFLESEVQKKAARHDLYQKMVAVDPNAPTEEEHKLQAVTKLRYMQFREQQSSTCSQGFRIEAMRFRGSPPVTDLKKVKSREEVLVAIALFLGGREDTRQRLLERLKEIRTKFEQSPYFLNHEIIGSSIFMIYDDHKVGAWIIDFAKTNTVPKGKVLNHRQSWVQGNYEEGFLCGLDSLISVFEEVDLLSPINHNSIISVPTTKSL